ncbi:hypothetical protein O3Q52_35680 [Streptomyces sp. ActVer]|nr:hypothetical protein [Streptomyces sp. ActVer]MCZ4513397.1 hypothetical protein [Streptomyces sp. ActVer]
MKRVGACLRMVVDGRADHTVLGACAWCWTDSPADLTVVGEAGGSSA